MFLITAQRVDLGVERTICARVHWMGAATNKRIKSALSNLGFLIN